MIDECKHEFEKITGDTGFTYEECIYCQETRNFDFDPVESVTHDR